MLLKMNAPPASSSDDSSRQLLLACIVSDPLVVAGKWADEPEAFKKMNTCLLVTLSELFAAWMLNPHKPMWTFCKNNGDFK